MENTRKQAIIVGAIALFAICFPVLGASTKTPSQSNEIASIQSNSLLPISSPHSPEKVIGKEVVIITAYTSRPEETDDTPFITASNTRVRPGIIATNMFPFGTRIRIPSLYGDKIFVVEDRMNARKNYQIDIWFSDTQVARDFGVKYADIEVLEG